MSWKGSWHYNERRIYWSSSMEYKTVKKTKENNGVVMYLAVSYRPTIKQSLSRKENRTANKLFFCMELSEDQKVSASLCLGTYPE